MEYRIHDWKQFNADKLAEIHPEKRDLAVQFLKGYFLDSPDTVAEIRACAAADPQTWWAAYHLTWGMAVRNLLRRNGFGEEDLGVQNLDDYYVGLIEAALL